MMTHPRSFVALVLGLALLAGCGRPTPKVDALGNTVGEVVAYEGMLSMRGSHPNTRLMLEMEDGNLVQVESRTIQKELKSLQGMRIEIEGEVRTPRDKARTAIVDASRYRLLRLPTGELPLVGTIIVLDTGECLLGSTSGKRYWIRGDLVSILREYQGERVWVVGTTGAAPGAPEGTEPYWVTGYGVLGQPASGM
jgi:hypothetical protein